MSATIEVMSTTALKSALDEIVPRFERASGNKVNFTWMPSAQIATRVGRGERFDIAVATAEVIGELIDHGAVAAGSVVNIARSEIGMAVQLGACAPDISTAEHFREAMLSARSIATSNPVGGGQSGRHLLEIFQRLGIMDAVKPKLRYGQGGPAGLVGHFLVRGEADVALQQVPELLSVPNINVVGPLPLEIQVITAFAAALSANATNPTACKKFIRIFSSAETVAVLKAKGMQRT
jgi:molybdate transport system substrate-binding protein